MTALLQIRPSDYAWVEDASIAMIAILALVVLGFLFYKRIIVWGSTCDRLVENERQQKEAAIGEKNEAVRTVVRIADDFSGHLRAVLHELSSRRE